MIDPQIALEGRAPQFNDPLTAANKAQSLANLGNQAQLQQQAIAENRKALNDQQVLNSAIAQNTRRGADGVPVTDDNAVMNSLAAAGKGDLLEKYRNSVAAMQENRIKMQEQQDTINTGHIVHVGALANSILAIDDPVAQTAAYHQGVQMAMHNGWLKPGDASDTWNDQTKAQLQSYVGAATSIADQYKEKYGQEKLDALTGQVAASNERALAARDRAKAAEDKANQDEWADASFTSGGHPVAYNKRTGEYAVKSNISVDADPNAGGKGKQVTPDANLGEQRANQNDYEKNQAAETNALSLRTSLDQALKNGKTYVDKAGNVKAFSSLKNADGTALDADDVAALQAGMRQYRDVVQKQLENAVTEKNNAIQRNGGTPQISTADAIAAYRQGGPQQPASAAAARPAPKYKEGDVVVNKATKQRMVLKNNQWTPLTN
jgi:hypothetical protein